jgi:hypothetical protein
LAKLVEIDRWRGYSLEDSEAELVEIHRWKGYNLEKRDKEQVDIDAANSGSSEEKRQACVPWIHPWRRLRL